MVAAQNSVRLPPYVKGWPLIGNSIALIDQPVQFFIESARQYGPAFRIRYPTAPNGEWVVLAGVEANELASKRPELFSNREYFHRFNDETGTDDYLCTMDGERHAYFRKVMKAALSREAMAPFVPDMIRLIEDRVRVWKQDMVVPIFDHFQRLTADALALAAGGCPVSDQQYAHFARFATTFIGSSAAGRPKFLLKMPGYKRAKEAVHAFLDEMIRKHEQEPPGKGRRADVIDTVLQAKYPDGTPFGRADQHANAHLPYANGISYTGRISAFMLYELMKRPDLVQRITSEIDAAYAKGTPGLEDVWHMTTLRNCVKECFRRHPIAPAVPRYAVEDFEFAGCTVPKGSYVFFAISVPHFDERYFADPYKFDPDRYLPPRSEGSRGRAYSPWGLGRHACLSTGFVETVSMVTMVGLFRTLEVALDPADYKLKVRPTPLPAPVGELCLRVLAQRRHAATSEAPRQAEEGERAFLGLDFEAEELKRFVSSVERRSYRPGETIIRQGEPAEHFFVLTEGTVEVLREEAGKPAAHLADIAAGGYFGEIGLLHGVPRTATVVARSPVQVLAIGRELFTHMVAEHDMISGELAEMARRRVMANQLAAAIPGLDRASLAKVSSSLQRVELPAGAIIVKQGDAADRFYVIVGGEAEVVSEYAEREDIVLARLGPGEYFGEIGLLQNRARTATVRAATALELLALEREPFLALADETHKSGQAIAGKALQRLLMVEA
jgi:cytochrome P450/CRP-like cAMP-binding protein